MASISRQPNGRRAIQFMAGDGKRRTIRLGKASQRMAEGIKRRIEELNVAKITDSPIDRDTAQWLAGLDDVLHDKLVAVGLVPKRSEAEQFALGDFIDGYIEGRTEVKPGTKMIYRHAKQLLVDYFGEERPIADISAGDVDDWRRHLLQKGFADNTVRRRCGIARQFFKYAVRKRLLTENPFTEIDGGVTVRPNRDRDYFVSREEAARVLDACPDAQWRLLFALSRYGGLRCPSEHLALKWGDVDWEQDRMTIRSPKTEHHHGKAYRVMPIFPELRPYLDAVYDLAPEGTEHIITRYRERNSNLRTQLHRIIEKAGLKPWPKTFQNLRSTRETELAERFPIHVVCEWIGNSQDVAAKHYLQTTDDHFAQAIAEETGALQKAVQQTSECGSNDPQGITDFVGITAEPLISGVLELARQDSNLE